MSVYPGLSPALKPLVKAAAPSVTAPPLAMRPMPRGKHRGAFFHLDLLRSLRLHGRLFGLILVVGLEAAAVHVLNTWPIFDARCLVYIQPIPPRVPEAPGVWNSPLDGVTLHPSIEEQLDNLPQSDVLATALHKLPAHSWRLAEENDQAAVERLRHALTVERPDQGHQVSIQASASQASLAADIANAVAASFVERAGMGLRAGDPQSIQILGDELDRIRKALEADRAEQERLKRMPGTASPETKPAKHGDQEINALRLELTGAHDAHDEALARLTSLATADSAYSAAMDAEAEEILAADPGLGSRKAALNQRRAQLISQMAGLAPDDPGYQQNAEELAQIDASIEKMMNDLRARAAARIEQRLRNDLERTSADETRLNGQLAQTAGAAGSASSRRQRAGDLATDIERLQKRRTVVEDLYHHVSSENRAPGAVYVSAPALPPLHGSVLHLLRNVAIILLGTVVVALGSAVVARNLDSRVYIATDVERVLGLSPIAQLPDFHQVSSEVGNECLRPVAAAVEHGCQQNGWKSCIVTGMLPGAGASTVASGVAAMLEGMGRSSVLVDASQTPPPPRETLLQQMAGEREMDAETIVIADTAPLPVSAETEYLAQFVDSAIVVIQSGLTTRAQLRAIAQTFERLDMVAVGFVLNCVSIRKANSSFRQSVRAVEQRLAIQNRLLARHLPRTRPSTENERKSAQEPSVVSEPDAVKRPDDKPITEPSPQAGAAQPGNASSQDTDTGGSVAETKSAASPRAARGRGEPAKSAAGAKAHKSAPPRPASPVQASSDEPAAVASPSRDPDVPPPPEPPVAPVPPNPRASAAPVGSEPSLGDLPSEPENSAYVPESRLSGLRNLLVTLGRRSLNMDADATGESDSDIEPRFERATVRPANPDSPLAAADAPETSAPSRLTAQPEFLRPKAVAQPEKEEAEKEKEVVVRPTPPRRDNVDGEEVQTLPSWRGQYRKKRYPPL